MPTPTNQVDVPTLSSSHSSAHPVDDGPMTATSNEFVLRRVGAGCSNHLSLLRRRLTTPGEQRSISL
jgi:hypothetical protein